MKFMKQAESTIPPAMKSYAIAKELDLNVI